MKCEWLQRGRGKTLIVFCNGWGMDSHPFAAIPVEKYDVLNLYDFRGHEELTSILQVMKDYDERILLSWSMGVWAGQQVFSQHVHLFARKIAINGTLCPVHDELGIPRDLFTGTMEAWSDISRSKFYNRVCGNRQIYSTFCAHPPKRSLADQQEELGYYLKVAECVERNESIYTEIVVSDNDRIVPTAHQLAFWGEDNVMSVAGGHFLFYNWKCWDDLLTAVRIFPYTNAS
jgi:biotin synthesis protein BioG